LGGVFEGDGSEVLIMKILFFLLLLLSSCSEYFYTTQTDQANTSECFCIVKYDVKIGTYALQNNWEFIGYYDYVNDKIIPGPCDLVYIQFNFGKANGLGVRQFKDGFKGSTGVNDFFGTFSLVDNQTIEFSSISSSRVGTPPCLGNFESNFLTSLSGKKIKYKIVNNVLDLEMGNEVRMRFVVRDNSDF
jgi:hypothetical protein